MIIRHAIGCNICNDDLESHYRHDFVLCKYGTFAVDGKLDYL